MAEQGLLGPDAMRLILPTLVEGLSDGIAIAQRLGANSPLLYVNKAFERLTGYTRNEVMGKDCRYLQGTLLHKSGDGRGSPFPGRTYPTASVTGMPSAV